ncbi:N-acetylmuramoyl-L-alanine amidase family protein [Terriglobus sp. ADX1]|uniref:N-acetylmuramoyl-L-alanine amidase family protein n=1 Tax=Terriglobus sp. ADX1 TaxID=2794063 RepID=UPI002FE6448B
MKLLIPSLLLAISAAAQQPLVLIDPARGGSKGGAHIADRVEEKQVTLQVAQHLGNLLRARGFAVQVTRDSDVDTTNDQRAAIANTTHPIACILLYASSTGNGVHLFTTTLPQPSMVDPAAPVVWDEAQSAYAARSQALASGMREAFGRTRIPIASGTTWMRPLDNMQCPAVAIEMGPQKDGTAADDPPYQNRVAETIAGVLLFWKNKVGSMTPPAPPKPEPTATTPSSAPKPAMPTQPKPATPSPAPKPAAPAQPKPTTPKPTGAAQQ